MKNNKVRLFLFSVLTILGFIGVIVLLFGFFSSNHFCIDAYLQDARLSGFYNVFRFMCIVGIIGLVIEAILSTFTTLQIKNTFKLYKNKLKDASDKANKIS